MIGQRCNWGNPFSLLVLMTLPVYADLILSSRRLSHLLLFTSLNFISISPHGESLSGDYRRGVPPVPIPNTAVKPSAANGSRTLGPARVGHCQITARFFERRAGPLFCLYNFTPPRDNTAMKFQPNRDYLVSAGLGVPLTLRLQRRHPDPVFSGAGNRAAPQAMRHDT